MPDEPVLELIGAEHATIVDVTYKRIDLFLVQIFKNEKGEHVYIPMYYDLQDGDMIIFDDWQKANELAERWTVVLFKAIEREWIGAGEEIPQPEPVDPVDPTDPVDLTGVNERLNDITTALTELVEGLK